MLAIVIPYYKKRFIHKTLESLSNQTDKRFKVYIGNDKSPENPIDIIKHYDLHFDITYKEFEENLGRRSLVLQWKRCLEMTQGENWFMILGDDDYLGNNVVESFYKYFDDFSKKSNVVRYAKQNIYEKTSSFSDVQINPVIESVADSYYRRITGQTTSTLSEYIFKKELYDKYGFYDYPMAWQSDNRAWIEFSEEKPIYSINEAIVYVINSDESITGSSQYKNEKQQANLSFYKYLIKEKLTLFSKKQAIRVLHKYENEVKKKEKMSFKEYANLFPYYIKNYESKSFKGYLKKMIKSIANK